MQDGKALTVGIELFASELKCTELCYRAPLDQITSLGILRHYFLSKRCLLNCFCCRVPSLFSDGLESILIHFLYVPMRGLLFNSTDRLHKSMFKVMVVFNPTLFVADIVAQSN